MTMREVKDMSCQECRRFPIYYPEVHHLDGNRQNNSPTNLVLVCPHCHAHFIFRLRHEDIWILKIRGLSNAEIGKLLGISRQRVWQILKRQLVELSKLPEDEIDYLGKRLIQWQKSQIMKQQKETEETLRVKEEVLRKWRAEMSNKEVREWKEGIKEARLGIQKGKRRRINKKRMREIIISMINKEISKTGGKRR